MADHELTLEKCVQVCGSLDTLLKKSYGPNALHCLLCTSTGRMIITNSGYFVLKSLHLAHPIGRLVVNGVLSHHQLTGDNSKTFILMVTETLRCITEQRNRSGLSSAFQRISFIRDLSVIKNEILPPILTQLEYHYSKHGVDNLSLEEVKLRCQKLISGSLQGKFNSGARSHLTKVSEKFLFDNCENVERIAPVLLEITNNFDIICVDNPGESILGTRVLEGLVIQRDFVAVTAPAKDLTNAKLILVDYPLEECCPSDINTVIRIRTLEEATASLQLKQVRLKKLVDILSKNNVDIVLITEMVSELFAFLLSQKNISIVQCVPEETIERISTIGHLSVVSEDRDFLDIVKFSGKVASVMSVVIGGRRCVYLKGIESKSSDRKVQSTIVITAPTPGICDQVASVLNCTFKSLQMAFDFKQQDSQKWGVACPGGGAFEMSLYHQLKKAQKDGTISSAPSLQKACDILGNALLAVPYRILENSYSQPKYKKFVHLLTFLSSNANHCVACGHDFVKGIEGKCGREAIPDDLILEPFSSKVCLLYTVLQCLQQILKLDYIVPVSRALKETPDDDESD